MDEKRSAWREFAKGVREESKTQKGIILGAAIYGPKFTLHQTWEYLKTRIQEVRKKGGL